MHDIVRTPLGITATLIGVKWVRGARTGPHMAVPVRTARPGMAASRPTLGCTVHAHVYVRTRGVCTHTPCAQQPQVRELREQGDRESVGAVRERA